MRLLRGMRLTQPPLHLHLNKCARAGPAHRTRDAVSLTKEPFKEGSPQNCCVPTIGSLLIWSGDPAEPQNSAPLSKKEHGQGERGTGPSSRLRDNVDNIIGFRDGEGMPCRISDD
jgi:hypothetical protein